MTLNERLVWAAEFVRAMDGTMHADKVIFAANNASCAVQRVKDYLRRAKEELDPEVYEQLREMANDD